MRLELRLKLRLHPGRKGKPGHLFLVTCSSSLYRALSASDAACRVLFAGRNHAHTLCTIEHVKSRWNWIHHIANKWDARLYPTRRDQAVYIQGVREYLQSTCTGAFLPGFGPYIAEQLSCHESCFLAFI